MESQLCQTCGREGSMRVGVLPDGMATPPCPDRFHDVADVAWQMVAPLRALGSETLRSVLEEEEA